MRAIIHADQPLRPDVVDRIADALVDKEGDRLERIARRIAGRSELILALVVAARGACW
jgi:hypothetical protein